MSTPTTLLVRDVQLSRGARPVLRSVSLDVNAGEICALMGVSGAGKSTVLRAIAALEPINAGTIAVGDFVLRAGPIPRELQLRALRRHVGFVFQTPALFEHMTALENVMLAPVHTLGWPSGQADEVARRLLSSLGVVARADAYPRQLSGGEAQRVAIARALALDPTLLLMDEPTSALDPARRGALGDSLRALANDGRGLLIATHDVDFARSYADRVIVLHQGQIAEQGMATTVLSSPATDATRELLRGVNEERPGQV
ncbi:MAG TPA: ATP-binding cassette domain-containing protein [Gemmatimonadaceae bacterium]|nr:ATP-binding cassette domain-containing protein [Gemmatimonadaceae bacterium]